MATPTESWVLWYGDGVGSSSLEFPSSPHSILLKGERKTLEPACA